MNLLLGNIFQFLKAYYFLPFEIDVPVKEDNACLPQGQGALWINAPKDARSHGSKEGSDKIYTR